MQGNVPGMNYGPPSASGPSVPPPPRRSLLPVSLAALAVVLAAAALVISLVRKPEAPAPTPSTPTTAAASTQEIFVDDADRQLCQAIVPLMKESDERARAF